MNPARARPLTAGLALLVAGALAGTASCAKTGEPMTAQIPNQPPATARDGAPVFRVPADAEGAIERARLRIVDTDEPVEQRLRAHLDVFIDGKAVTVPRGIGVVDDRRASPLVTHDDSGTLHVTAREEETLRLGQLFEEWNVHLDKDCIARFCTSTNPHKQLLAFVNGELAADPSTIHLVDGAEIVVWYGNRDLNPTVPTGFVFPPTTPPPATSTTTAPG